MGYYIQMVTCKDHTLEGDVKPGRDPYGAFATYGDLLFTGQDLVPDLPEGAHVTDVKLAYEAPTDGSTTMVAAVFLLCQCGIDVDTSARSQSKLITPPPGITLPTGARR